MPILKEEFLLLRFSRLLRDSDPFPANNVIVNTTVAANAQFVANLEIGEDQLLAANVDSITTSFFIQP